MQIAFPEKNKKAGVAYAVTDDGMELPVVDVTHPAFALDLSESEVDRLLQEYARSVKSQGKLEAFIQSLFLRIMSQRSLIMRGIMVAAGGYMTGISTYLLKLGPDNLGQGYASQIDRQIAGSISGLSVRLRLQDIAHLLADGLAPLLGIGRKSSLHLLNIGGGPAIDSLNVLLILQKDRPDLLAGRPVYVHILDLEAAGPNFGRRALQALQAEGAPLYGLSIRFEHTQYNWSDLGPLRELLRSLERNAIMGASSEGALFEYGSDEDIALNLQALHELTPIHTIIAGSVTRADATGRIMNSTRAALQMRGLELFSALVQRVGWRVAIGIDRPICHDVRLEKI
jgi:hypothetical protein